MCFGSPGADYKPEIQAGLAQANLPKSDIAKQYSSGLTGALPNLLAQLMMTQGLGNSFIRRGGLGQATPMGQGNTTGQSNTTPGLPPATPPNNPPLPPVGTNPPVPPINNGPAPNPPAQTNNQPNQQQFSFISGVSNVRTPEAQAHANKILQDPNTHPSIRQAASSPLFATPLGDALLNGFITADQAKSFIEDPDQQIDVDNWLQVMGGAKPANYPATTVGTPQGAGIPTNGGSDFSQFFNQLFGGNVFNGYGGSQGNELTIDPVAQANPQLSQYNVNNYNPSADLLGQAGIPGLGSALSQSLGRDTQSLIPQLNTNPLGSYNPGNDPTFQAVEQALMRKQGIDQANLREQFTGTGTARGTGSSFAQSQLRAAQLPELAQALGNVAQQGITNRLQNAQLGNQSLLGAGGLNQQNLGTLLSGQLGQGGLLGQLAGQAGGQNLGLQSLGSQNTGNLNQLFSQLGQFNAGQLNQQNLGLAGINQQAAQQGIQNQLQALMTLFGGGLGLAGAGIPGGSANINLGGGSNNSFGGLGSALGGIGSILSALSNFG